MNKYLFVYSPDFGDTEKVIEWLDEQRPITDWTTLPDLLNALVLSSDLSTSDLTRHIGHNYAAVTPRFVLAQININEIDGCLENETWGAMYVGAIPQVAWDAVFKPLIGEKSLRNEQ